MAHAQKPDFFFRRNGRVHLNWRGRQFSRLPAAEMCASAVAMLDTPRSEVVWEYWLPTPFASFPFTSPPVRHRVPSGFKRTLPVLLSPAWRYIMNTMVIGDHAWLVMKPPFLLQVLPFRPILVASCTGQQERKHVTSHKNSTWRLARVLPFVNRRTLFYVTTSITTSHRPLCVTAGRQRGAHRSSSLPWATFHAFSSICCS